MAFLRLLACIALLPILSVWALIPPAATYRTFLPRTERQSCGGAGLLGDGSFELGVPHPYWQVASNMLSDVLDDTPMPAAHNGSWKAWLGGDDLVQESLWQTFDVPADKQRLRLVFWWRVETFEEAHPFDTLHIQIRDANGTVLRTLYTLSDANAGTTWQQSAFLLEGYGGRRLQLAFVANTDRSYPTSFFLDDVFIQTLCPG